MHSLEECSLFSIYCTLKQEILSQHYPFLFVLFLNRSSKNNVEHECFSMIHEEKIIFFRTFCIITTIYSLLQSCYFYIYRKLENRNFFKRLFEQTSPNNRTTLNDEKFDRNSLKRFLGKKKKTPPLSRDPTNPTSRAVIIDVVALY